MPANLLPFLIPLPILLILSGVFSGSETALFGLTYAERLHLRRGHPGVARAVAHLLAHPRRLLITVLLLNTSVNVLYFVITSVLVLNADPQVGVVINLIALAALIIFGEVLAKLLAGARRGAFCVMFARPLFLIHSVLGPFLRFTDTMMISPMTRLLRPSRGGDPLLTAEELSALIDIGGREGAINPREQELLADILKLGELRVREVMTPRVDLIWLDHDEGIKGAIRLASEHPGLGSIPVGDGGIDRGALGMLQTGDLLAAHAAGKAGALGRYVHKTVYVPESTTLDASLTFLRDAGEDTALVVDEYGGVVGSVRIEDIAGELVGEVEVEGAGDGAVTDIQIVGLATWSVPGRLPIRAWSEMFGRELTHRATTLGGLVVAILGRMPREGDSAALSNVRFTVEGVSGRVIDRVTVSLIDGPDEGGAGMNMEVLAWCVGVGVGVGGSALCSGTEIGLYSANRVRLAVRVKSGVATGGERRLLHELDRPERSLVTLLLANTFFNNLGSVGMAALLTIAGFSEVAIVVLSALVLTPLLFLFAETLPKELFRSGSDRAAAAMSLPLQLLRWLLTIIPLVPLLTRFARLVGRLVHASPSSTWRDPRLRIAALLKEGAGYGLVSDSQAQLLDRAVALRDLRAVDEMTAWRQSDRLPLSADRSRRIAFIRRTPHARFPVIDDQGRVVGVVDRTSIALDPDAKVSALMADPVFVDAEMSVLPAMTRLYGAGVRLAIVGTREAPLGVVTAKDLIEPLTGDLESW